MSVADIMKEAEATLVETVGKALVDMVTPYLSVKNLVLSIMRATPPGLLWDEVTMISGLTHMMNLRVKILAQTMTKAILVGLLGYEVSMIGGLPHMVVSEFEGHI